MGNRIFVALVMLLWASTMSWLMVSRILPPFFQGEPPSHGIHDGQQPLCWEIQHGDRAVGFAVSQTVPGALGTTEIYSRVQLRQIELRQFAPQWMESLVHSLGEVSFDTRTRLVLDSLGNLSTFDTSVKLNDMPIVMKVVGRVDGPELRLRIQTGEISHEVSYPVANTAWMSSELMPESKLLQVYVGRKWQQEVFSPFRPPNSSMELMQAEVVEEGLIEHRRERVHARKIEMRSMSAAGVAADNTLRSVMWVADDGTVLRQDVYMINATKLRFDRCSEPAMVEMAGELLDLASVATIAPNGTVSLMIEFDQVCRSYGDKLAVDHLNLVIRAGELYALLGHNGAGKTTAIKMLVGLLRPGMGAIRVGGYDVVAHTREASSLIGYVPDQPFLYDKLSGREILQFVAKMYGMDTRQANLATDRIVERFELDEFANELTESYSHGMKQRTVFASAMLHAPRVLVIDEPMVGLDPHSVRLVKDLLKQEVAAGLCVFMSTHTLPAVEEMAQRVGIMNHGRLVYDGTIDRLRQQLLAENQTLETMYLTLTESGPSPNSVP